MFKTPSIKPVRLYSGRCAIPVYPLSERVLTKADMNVLGPGLPKAVRYFGRYESFSTFHIYMPLYDTTITIEVSVLVYEVT